MRVRIQRSLDICAWPYTVHTQSFTAGCSSSSPTDSESSEVIEVVVETFARSSLLLLSRYLEMIY
ncbi:hypothetical protein SCLCIDRAFT_600491 [Scleroderma citrinum Foug A]|uniref:Uncharacterized protein n=1 Tax=Scleroderma citrinum Foug A TaxID=1036808 RepID=A0A0C3AJ16_9AGAM|nr:hypothetical protein SCLCIDRAFT_600491 [Scleroderma citrinum Foug A]